MAMINRRGVLALVALGATSIALDLIAQEQTETPDTSAHVGSIPPHNVIAPRSAPSTAAPAVPLTSTTPLPTFTTPPRQWGTDLPGILRRLPSDAVALTFDACGGPGGSGVDTALLDCLHEHRVPATLFLNERWITANPSIARHLAADPLFELANHGTRHQPMSTNGRAAYRIPGTRSPDACADEVRGNTEVLRRLTGRIPRFFRAGTAYYDEQAVAIVRALGQVPAGFAVNGDAGATLPAARVTAQYLRVRPGDVVISHMNQPRSGTAAGVAAALPKMLRSGLHFVRLSDVV